MKTLRKWFIENRVTSRQFFQLKQKLMSEYLDKKTLEQLVRETFTIVD